MSIKDEKRKSDEVSRDCSGYPFFVRQFGGQKKIGTKSPRQMFGKESNAHAPNSILKLTSQN